MTTKAKKTKNLLPEILSFLYKSILLLGILASISLQLLLVAQNEYANQKVNERFDQSLASINDIKNRQSEFERRIFPTNEPAAEPNPSVPIAGEHRFGSADTQYTLIAYTDLECPFCRQAFPIEKSFIENNQDASLVFRHFPLDGEDSSRFKLSVISECSFEQKGEAGFWDTIETIFSSSDLKTLEVKDFAILLNLDQEQLEKCINQESVIERVRKSKDEGIEAGIQGTPSLFLYDKKTNKFKFINGLTSYDQIQKEFDNFKS
jgi:protein-disulfide isomerase